MDSRRLAIKKETITIMKKLLIALLFLASCGNDPNTTTNDPKAENLTAESKLATVDKGYLPDSTDVSVVRIKTLLGYISEAWHESKDTIAEYTYQCQASLKDEGIEETCQNILEDMNSITPLKGMKYKDAIILYTMTRSHGNNRK